MRLQHTLEFIFITCQAYYFTTYSDSTSPVCFVIIITDLVGGGYTLPPVGLLSAMRRPPEVTGLIPQVIVHPVESVSRWLLPQNIGEVGDEPLPIVHPVVSDTSTPVVWVTGVLGVITSLVNSIPAASYSIHVPIITHLA